MGLDQYVYITTEDVIGPVDFDCPEKMDEFWYWRKHPDLHGWMEALYHARGGEGNLNLNALALTIEDIEVLEGNVLNNSLPHTEGFFFGKSYYEHEKETLDFCASAKRLISDNRDGQGNHINFIYTAWW